MKQLWQWLRKNLKYIRVIFVGTMSAAIISGVYGFMSNIQSIQVWKSYNEWIPSTVTVDGIQCYGVSGYTKECDIMAKQMANSTSSHTEWKCSLFTDYSSTELFDDINSFRNWFIILVSFTFIYGLFSIIHDCTLIYYDHLNEIMFYPSTERDLYLFYKAKNYFFQIGKSFFETEHNDCFWWICMLPIVVLMMILIGITIGILALAALSDIVLNLFIYLFTRCCTISHININPFSYVSSSWVAISRSMILISTYSSVGLITLNGFNKSIPSMDASECLCSCIYTFQEVDFYKFILVTYTLMLLSIKFLWSWFQESIHLKDYYYLIQFSLPAELTKQINQNDCTGTMMEQLSVNLSEANTIYRSLNDDEKNDELNQIVMRENKDFSKISFIWRAVILLISICFFGAGVALTLVGVVFWNMYNYSIPIRVMFGLIQIIMVVMVLYFCLWFFNYTEKEFKKATDPIHRNIKHINEQLQKIQKLQYIQYLQSNK